MKKKIDFSLLLAIVLITLLFCLTGCGLWSIPLKSISFEETSLEIKVGQEVQLAPTVSPSTAISSVKYESSNKAVATVTDSGLLKGIGGGAAIITAANVLGTVSAQINVTVTYDEIPTDGLILAADNAQQRFGDQIEAVEFTLSWGNVSVPDSAVIQWYRKVKADSEFTLVADADGKTEYSVTPSNEMGYSATMQVRVTYDHKTYVSNDIIYGVYDEMRDVRLSYSESDTGLVFESNTYYADLGEPFTLTLTWNENSNQDPEIKWYVQKGDGPRAVIANQNEAVLVYAVTPTGSDTAETMIDDYIITAVADDVANNAVYNFYFSTDYADVKNATLSAEGHTGTQISMTTLDATDLVFTAGWNSKCTKNSDVVIEYYTADPKQENETEFTYTLRLTVNATDTDISYVYSPALVAGVYAVKTVVYNSAGSEIKSEAVLTVTMLETYNDVEELSLSVKNGNLEQTVGIYNDVVFEAAPSPSDCLNSTLTYSWYVDGILQGESSSQFTLSGSYLSAHLGETAVTAKFGGVESRILTAYAFENAVSSMTYLNNKFIWNGDEYNHYISSMDEFEIAVSYVAFARAANQYFCFDSGSGISFTTDDQLKAYVQQLYQKSCKTGPTGFFLGANSENVALISWGSGASILSEFDESSPYYDPATDINPVQLAGENAHYSTSVEVRTSVPLDGETETLNVTNSDMLYCVASWGLKPTFNAVSGENTETETARLNAQTIYNNARNVLLDICDDGMSDLEKVHAIYDWICENVQYDYALAGAQKPDGMTDSEFNNALCAYDGFYLEGIFLKSAGETRKAVCDGKAKAFALMCGMEGIRSYRVIGFINGDSAAGHAWNKVLLDANADGVKHWYVADSTLGDSNISGKEYLRHNYFLLGDDEITCTEENPENSHTETHDYYPEADDSDFEFYVDLSYTVPESMLDGEHYEGLIKVAGEISNTAVALISTEEQLAVMLAVAQISGYIDFKIATGVDFNGTFFNNAKYMLTDESGSWSSSVDENSCYCYIYTAD